MVSSWNSAVSHPRATDVRWFSATDRTRVRPAPSDRCNRQNKGATGSIRPMRLTEQRSDRCNRQNSIRPVRPTEQGCDRLYETGRSLLNRPSRTVRPVAVAETVSLSFDRPRRTVPPVAVAETVVSPCRTPLHTQHQRRSLGEGRFPVALHTPNVKVDQTGSNCSPQVKKFDPGIRPNLTTEAGVE